MDILLVIAQHADSDEIIVTSIGCDPARASNLKPVVDSSRN
jgi:hypothetical protein